MDSIYINEFIEQIQKEHEEEKMSMTQETIKMIEEHKEFLDKKRAEWEIERKRLKRKIRKLNKIIIEMEDMD